MHIELPNDAEAFVLRFDRGVLSIVVNADDDTLTLHEGVLVLGEGQSPQRSIRANRARRRICSVDRGSELCCSAMSESFDFVGAGEASYYEYAEMFVYFTQIPGSAEAAAIAKRVPAQLRDTFDWHGSILAVASARGVKGSRQLNADIDAWLTFAHTKVAILLAYRRQDAEAGGTELSDWHRRSVRAIPNVLPQLARLAKKDATAANLGLALVEEARSAKVSVDAKLAAALRKLQAAHEEADEAERVKHAETVAAAATKALGRPSAKGPQRRALDDLEPALARLEKQLPLTSFRLRRMAAKGLTVGLGASAAAIAEVDKSLGGKLSAAHRALLEAFDGGEVGKIVFLGTSTSAAGDRAIADFTRAWSGEDDDDYTVVARTGRDHVVVVPRKGSGPALILGRNGELLRESKRLDSALDLVLKTGSVKLSD